MVAKTGRKGAQRLSRKKKKYWRRGTNLTDVEEDLEFQRSEVRLGGPLSEKSDSDLFVIHATSSTGGAVKPAVGLRCFRSLEPSSLTVAAKTTASVVFKKRPIKSQQRRLPQGKRRSRKSRKALAGSTIDQNATGAADSLCSKMMPSSSRCEMGVYDLWDPKPMDHPASSLESTVSPFTMTHIKNQGRSRASKPPKAYLEKSSELCSVETAHPGASYNPSYADYQELVTDVVEAEKNKIREEEKIARALALPELHERATTETTMWEMSQGLFDHDSSSSEAEADSSQESADDQPGEESDIEQYRAPAVPTSSLRRKSKAQRRREAEAEVQRATAEKIKEERRRLNAVYSIKRLNAEIKLKEALTERRRQRRARRRALKTSLGPGKHSRYAFSVPDKEVSLPEELEGSLRLLTPEGNLLEDRFKSLQKRNIVETRIRQKRVRKYKRKAYETRSHRAITVEHRVI